MDDPNKPFDDFSTFENVLNDDKNENYVSKSSIFINIRKPIEKSHLFQFFHF